VDVLVEELEVELEDESDELLEEPEELDVSEDVELLRLSVR
jgi:hypothetical protein